MKTYRFSFLIEDDETDEKIITGRTLFSHVDPDGGCEMIELELYAGLRAFNKTLEEKPVMETFVLEIEGIDGRGVTDQCEAESLDEAIAIFTENHLDLTEEEIRNNVSPVPPQIMDDRFETKEVKLDKVEEQLSKEEIVADQL